MPRFALLAVLFAILLGGSALADPPSSPAGSSSTGSTPCGFHDGILADGTHRVVPITEWAFAGTNPHVAWQVPGVESLATPAVDDAARPDAMWYTSLNATQANYEAGPEGEDAHSGTATSIPITPPLRAWLVFDSWYDIEARNAAHRDIMKVEYSRNNGPWTLICTVNPTTPRWGLPHQTTCSNGTPEGAFPCPRDALHAPLAQWEIRTMPLPPGVAGNLARFRFTFDTVDGLQNSGTGWKVAHVRFSPEPPPPEPPLPVIRPCNPFGNPSC